MTLRGDDNDEKKPIQRDLDCLDPKGSRGRREGERPVSPLRHQRRDVLQLEVELRGYERVGAEASEGDGGRARAAQTDVRGGRTRELRAEGSDRDKALGPLENREAAAI